MMGKWLSKIHLFLGLASGIVIFIVSVTGALYAFKEEVEQLTQEYKNVTVRDTGLIPPSEAIRIGKRAMPDKHIHGVVCGEENRALEVIYYQEEPMFYGAAYLNPYSGEVLKTTNYLKTFFGFILKGHISLWLPLHIGKPIVAVSVVVFLFLLVSGLILWWPGRLRGKGVFWFTLKRSLSVQRLEWHKVVGFYVMWLALVLVLTGMVMAFEGVERAAYKAIGGEKELMFSYPLSDTSKMDGVQHSKPAIDRVWERMRQDYPHLKSIEMHTAETPESSILVELNRDPATHWKMDYLYFDQHSLEELRPDHIYNLFDESDFPDKVRRMNYDVHIGSIWGLPGKILVFLVSAFCASLPVTGFLLWWSRQKQKRLLIKELNSKFIE